jgi:hypothetical protein
MYYFIENTQEYEGKNSIEISDRDKPILIRIDDIVTYNETLQQKVFSAFMDRVKLTAEQSSNRELLIAAPSNLNKPEIQDYIQLLKDQCIVLRQKIVDQAPKAFNSIEKIVCYNIFLSPKYLWHLFNQKESQDIPDIIFDYNDYEDFDSDIPDKHRELTQNELEWINNPKHPEYIESGIPCLNRASDYLSLCCKTMLIDKLSVDLLQLHNNIDIKSNEVDLKSDKKTTSSIIIQNQDEPTYDLNGEVWTPSDVAKCLYLRVVLSKSLEIKKNGVFKRYADVFIRNNTNKKPANASISTVYKNYKDKDINEFKQLLRKGDNLQRLPQYLRSLKEYNPDETAFEWLKDFITMNNDQIKDGKS